MTTISTLKFFAYADRNFVDSVFTAKNATYRVTDVTFKDGVKQLHVRVLKNDKFTDKVVTSADFKNVENLIVYK